MQRKHLIIGLVCIVVALAIIVPIVVFVNKDPSAETILSCYPEFDGEESCYAENIDKWYRWYGPKTDYAISTGLNGTDKATVVEIPDCEPMMLYLFSRHSARYPDLADLEKQSAVLHMIRNMTMDAAAAGKVKLCDKDIEELRQWEPLYHFEDAAKAMQQGNEDVHVIAQRYKKYFPTLLPDKYSNEAYKFGISNRERTNQSLQAFLEKIFDDDELARVEYPPKDVKTVSFHKTCERKLWPHRSKPSRELFDEPEAFRRGAVAQRLVENVKRRLGLEETNLTYSEIRQIAVECAVSFTAYRASPWCGVLSKDDLLVTEYDDDIYDFYKDSYGRPLNHKMGCPVVEEIVNLFGGVAEKPNATHLKAVLYFSHSRDYKKLLGSFDLFRDDKPLTADGYCSEGARNRKWRDATMSPYSANIGFVLFKCKGTYKVLTLLNEKPIQLPHCSYKNDDYLCDLREFSTESRLTKNCDINKICVPAAIHEQWPDSNWENK